MIYVNPFISTDLEPTAKTFKSFIDGNMPDARIEVVNQQYENYVAILKYYSSITGKDEKMLIAIATTYEEFVIWAELQGIHYSLISYVE